MLGHLAAKAFKNGHAGESSKPFKSGPEAG